MSRHDTHRGPVTVRMARWSATHPWRAIGLWLVLVIACVGAGSTMSLKQADDLDFAQGQSGQAAHWLHDAGLDRPDTENVLVTSTGGRLDTAEARAALADATRRMQGLDDVLRVSEPSTSPDRTAMVVQVTLRRDTDDKGIEPLLAATAAVQKSHPDVRVEQVGDLSLDKAVNDLVGEDLASASSISTPVTLVILLIAFGALLAAGVPVLLALSAVASATGLSTLVSHVFPDSGSTSAMILLMGMAVGVDYSLFYVKRARAERHRGFDKHRAVDIAAATSGHSVLVSGVAVIVAMAGMYVADDVVFSSLATGSILVVAIAVLGSLTVLPALLVALGRAIDRPRVPIFWRLTAQDREPRLWPAILRPSLDHPRRTLLASVLVLGAVALPALGLHLQSDSLTTLPSALAEKHTMERLTDAFPQQGSDTTVVVRAGSASSTEVETALRDIAGAPGNRFSGGRPDIRSSADGTVHVLTLTANADPESSMARTGVHALRDGLVADRINDVAGARWAVGGEVASAMDGDDHLAGRMPWVIGFVVVLTMVIMAWVFRSAVIVLATAAMNLLSAGASFGVLVLVFQHSWAESLLGFENTGRVIGWIPLFMFAVLFGLSMDYHVFVISRIREAAARGLSTRDAIREGIVGSAGTVTSAALIMVSVFSIFASLHLVEMKQFGVGLAVAVLVDAIVVRGIVLPSLLMLTGDRTWWPGKLPAAAPPSRSSFGSRSQSDRPGAVLPAVATYCGGVRR